MQLKINFNAQFMKEDRWTISWHPETMTTASKLIKFKRTITSMDFSDYFQRF